MSLKLLNLILSLVLRFHIYKKHLVGCCAQRILHLLDLIVLLLVEITYLNLEDSNTKVVVVKEWRQATMTRILTLEDRNLEVLFVTIVISRGHMKRDCRKLQNKKTQSACIASTSDTSEYFVTISLINMPNSLNTCLVSSSTKWVINSGAIDHMTDNSKLFFAFSHIPPLLQLL